MKEPRKYEPILVYMVQKHGMFVSPYVEGFMCGASVWNDKQYHFTLEEAKDFAYKINGQVIKLRLSAKAELIKGPDAPWKAPVVN